MSLLVIGSCSKVTQNIILSLSKQNHYKKITIVDPLPLYHHHQRFYKLLRDLNEHKNNTSVSIDKIVSLESIHHQVNSHEEVLHVTHDYFTSVTSKQKIMEITASLTQHKEKVLFASPIEYDHYGEQNPEQTYLNAKEKVLSINPKASFIRSDVQDSTEFYAYLYKSKKIWEQITVPNSFKPLVVGSSFFTNKVVEQLKGGPQGLNMVIKGDKQRQLTQVAHNREIEDTEMDHHGQNINRIVTGYKGPEDRFGEICICKFGQNK